MAQSFGMKWIVFIFFLGLLGCTETSETSETSEIEEISTGESSVASPLETQEGQESSDSRLLDWGSTSDVEEVECVPSCMEGSCDGDNGCGEPCVCDADLLCVDSTCCAPNCDDKTCGSDGCGGDCGDCTDGMTCFGGNCCAGDCSGKECGVDGCGGSCGVCSDSDAPLCDNGVCVPTCIPNCVGKECGYDGCSGSCGLCTEPGKTVCTEGSCGPDESCGPDGCLLTGKVFAPLGGIPIAGAEVYLLLGSPPPLNDSLHCDKCFQFSEGTPLAITDSAGQFELPVGSAGEYFLAVQKGGFRRVRPFSVTGGFQLVSEALTTLPGEPNADLGDSVPKMAVAGDVYDKIEDTLTGLGISFDLYNASSEGVSLLTDWDLLSQYQIVFLPCASGWFDSYLNNPDALETLRNFVSAGGRLYVTDWSYDILANTFPDPISYTNHNGSLGSAEGGVYDAPAKVVDAGLAAWLEGQEITDFDLEANWTELDKVNTYEAPNELNIPSVFEPTVWVKAIHDEFAGEEEEGDVRPATVSFQWGCGRALFSTYHTESGGGFFGSDSSSLLPQEKALLYTILEVVLCIGPKI